MSSKLKSRRGLRRLVASACRHSSTRGQSANVRLSSHSPTPASYAVSRRATHAKSATERRCSSCVTASGQPVQLQIFRPCAALVKYDVALRRLVRHQRRVAA